MEFKNVLTKKRMASLNATAMLAATYEVERAIDKQLSKVDAFENKQDTSNDKEKNYKDKDKDKDKSDKTNIKNQELEKEEKVEKNDKDTEEIISETRKVKQEKRDSPVSKNKPVKHEAGEEVSSLYKIL